MLTFSVNLDVLEEEKVKKVVKLISDISEANRGYVGPAYISVIEGKDTKGFSLNSYTGKAEKNKIIRLKENISLSQEDEKITDNIRYSYKVEDKAIRNSDIDIIISDFLDLREKCFLKKGIDIWRLVDLVDNNRDKMAAKRLYAFFKENDRMELFSDLFVDEQVISVLRKKLQ